MESLGYLSSVLWILLVCWKEEDRLGLEAVVYVLMAVAQVAARLGRWVFVSSPPSVASRHGSFGKETHCQS